MTRGRKQRQGAVERLSIADQHDRVGDLVAEGRFALVDGLAVAHDGDLHRTCPLA